MSSLFRKSGRNVDDIGEGYADQFTAIDPVLTDAATYAALFGADAWTDAVAADDGLAVTAVQVERCAARHCRAQRMHTANLRFSTTVTKKTRSSQAVEQCIAALYNDLLADPAATVSGPAAGE